MNTMRVLGIDTSTAYLSVAITDDINILASSHNKERLKHFDLLLPTIDRLLKGRDLRLKDIAAIALSIGPGSFTGLRIGVATCKGINLTLGIPIVVVPTLDVIAYNFINEQEDLLCPIIDAKKQKIYTCLYKNRLSHLRGVTSGFLERVMDYMLLDIDGLLGKIVRPTLVFGDGLLLYSERCKRNPHIRISTKDWIPKAEVVAKLGLVKARKRQFENPDKLVPMYLHSKYCQVREKYN